MESDDINDSERALAAARTRGVVDELLLEVLRREPLACGVEEVDGRQRPAARQLGSGPAVLAWTSADRAARSGWTGTLTEQPGAEIARLLVGTGLGLALNAGEELGVALDPLAVERLAAEVPAGTAVYLGEPAVPQVQLERELAAALAAVPGVVEARLATLVIGEDGVPETTVVLTLAPGSSGSDRELAFAACDRAAEASGPTHLAAVVDEQLGGLREAALALPIAYRASPAAGRP